MKPTISDKMELTWEKLSCRFSLDEIQSATQNFDEELVIGRGGFGKVYRGNFDNGSSAAIKRLDSGSNQGASEFWAEIEMLSRLRHSHLVSLIGYCNDENEMILVYELMPHGTLADHLHKLGTRLSWLQRLKVCIGAARGLDYLHTGTGTHHGIIHRDVKSTNILLDDNWEAKISDFGLSKVGPTNQPFTYVSTAVKGTFGYLDPEYFSTGRLTRKSDVYAFGVVLLEVLCGRRAVENNLDEEQCGLVGWAQDSIKEGKLLQIIDSSLSGQILLSCSSKFSQIALQCVHNRPKERPTMAEVVVGLESALALQEKLDYSEPGFAATTKKKITFTRKIQKFFLPSMPTSVHGDTSPSRKNGNINDGKSYNDDLVLNKDEDNPQELADKASAHFTKQSHFPVGVHISGSSISRLGERLDASGKRISRLGERLDTSGSSISRGAGFVHTLVTSISQQVGERALVSVRKDKRSDSLSGLTANGYSGLSNNASEQIKNGR